MNIFNLFAVGFLGFYFINGLSILCENISEFEWALALGCYGWLMPDILRLLKGKKKEKGGE